MVKSNYEAYLILRKLDYAFHLKMENVLNPQLIANMLMDRDNSESLYTIISLLKEITNARENIKIENSLDANDLVMNAIIDIENMNVQGNMNQIVQEIIKEIVLVSTIEIGSDLEIVKREEVEIVTVNNTLDIKDIQPHRLLILHIWETTTQPTCCRHKQAAILHLRIFQPNHQEIPHNRRVQQCRVTKLYTAWEHPMNLAMDTIILLLIQHQYDTYIFCLFFSLFLF